MGLIRLFGQACVFFIYLFCSLASAETGGMSARFTKIDAQGVELPDSASAWAIVKDNTTGLFWEVKTTDDSLHNKNDIYKWSSAQKDFLPKLNDSKFGGFTDWRIPTSDELSGLLQAGEEPLVAQNYFPNTEPSEYLSWRLCGSGEITTEKVSFGSVKIKGRDKHVRAVRGGKSE